MVLRREVQIGRQLCAPRSWPDETPSLSFATPQGVCFPQRYSQSWVKGMSGSQPQEQKRMKVHARDCLLSKWYYIVHILVYSSCIGKNLYITLSHGKAGKCSPQLTVPRKKWDVGSSDEILDAQLNFNFRQTAKPNFSISIFRTIFGLY